MFQECVKEGIEVYSNFEGVSKNFRGVLREISRVFQECFIEVSWKFPEIF